MIDWAQGRLKMASILTKYVLRNFYSPRSMRLKARWRVAPLQDWQQVDLLLDPACARYTPPRPETTQRRRITGPRHSQPTSRKRARRPVCQRALWIFRKLKPNQSKQKERHKRTGVRMMQGMINRRNVDLR